MTRSPRIPAVALALLVAACGGSGTNDPSTPNTPGTNPTAGDTPALNRTVVLQGLSSPWDIAIAADGAMFFTEKCRGLSVRRADGSVTRLFGTSGSALVAPDLACEGQSGVHGVALDPAFATNRTLYVYMLSSPRPRRARIVSCASWSNAGYTSAEQPHRHHHRHRVQGRRERVSVARARTAVAASDSAPTDSSTSPPATTTTRRCRRVRR